MTTQDDKPQSGYQAGKTHHILGTSANLMGICFVIITGIKLTDKAAQTYADDICLLAALLFLASCLLSYLSIRNMDRSSEWLERWADHGFILGIGFLFAAICSITFGF